MKTTIPSFIAGLVWYCAVASVATAQSDGQYHSPDGSIILEQGDARDAVARGAAVSLETILREPSLKSRGELVGEKLELYKGALLYELRFVGFNGHMRFFHFSASTGQPYRP